MIQDSTTPVTSTQRLESKEESTAAAVATIDNSRFRDEQPSPAKSSISSKSTKKHQEQPERQTPNMDSRRQQHEEDDPFSIRDELLAAPRPNFDSNASKSNIVEFYKNRSVLITGASGFIGKVLIEKLLRTCPQLKRIFVLIRPKWNKQPAERLKELLEAPLFDGVRNGGGLAGTTSLEQRVVLVEGDVTQRNLGLSKQNLVQIYSEVSVIFHSAATVKFDEPLKQSIGINIAGTKNMIELCRRIPQLAALVHVSTAYANCDRPEVDEHIYPMEQLDPEKLIKMADWLDQETLQELKRRLLGQRPNTYTYTKALAEWLLIRSARDLPVVICRPSIVVASWREPFSGWIDNVNGPTGIVLGAGKGLIRTMFAEKHCVADLVPVDTVINLVVALGWFAHLYNRNQLSEAAESLTDDSLLGSGGSNSSSVRCSTTSSRASSSASDGESSSVSGDDERNGGHLTPVSMEDDEDEQQQQMGKETPTTPKTQIIITNNNNNNESDMNLNHNNNNNNNEGEDDDVAQCKKKLTTTTDLNMNENNNIGQQQQNHHLHLAARGGQPPTDDGYGSSRSSTYAHSTKSSSSSSSSSSCSSSSSPNRLINMHHRSSTSSSTSTIITAQRKASSSSSLSTLTNNQRQSIYATSSSNPEAELLDCKLSKFRQMNRAKLIEKNLPEDLVDIPVFHCTSGSENPITWGQIQVLIITFLSIFPSSTTYRYPCGSFTSNKTLDNFYRITLHYIPGYLVDFITRLAGGKPIIVKIFKKFDQAAAVLKAFTSQQWKFQHHNRLALFNELMNDEDRRLFNCDISELDWNNFCRNYVIGVKKFMLKEPMSNLEAARRNLTIVYYRNLALQLLSLGSVAYYFGALSYLPQALTMVPQLF